MCKIKYLAYIAIFYLVSGLPLSAAATPEEPDATDNKTDLYPAEYKIGPGDVLRISVWKEEGMELETLVKPDGGITFPLAGEIKASGLTTPELTTRIEDKLKRFIPNPVVTVSVLQTVSNKIYVVGKVNRPGEYQATRYMDVLQALSIAGGLTPYAESDEIKIIRRTDGEKKVFTFDYDEVINGEQLDTNIILQAGDTIAVP